MSDFQPGQRVEVFLVTTVSQNSDGGYWCPATLLRQDRHGQWYFSVKDRHGKDHEGWCVERWLRPPHPLIQLAEVIEK